MPDDLDPSDPNREPATGFNVVSITDKAGRPVRRSWRVAVLLAGPPAVLGTAILTAETATAAAQRCRAELPSCTVFDVRSATDARP